MALHVGDTVLVSASFKRPDGTPLADAAQVEVNVANPSGGTLPALTLMGGGVANAGSGNYTAMFELTMVGTYTVTVKVTSPAGEKKSAAVNVNVKPL